MRLGDLGIRRAFLPAFDAYGVDLVLCGHDHDYERTYTVRGTDPGTAVRPTPAATAAVPNPAPVLFDTFTMSTRRRDGLLHGHGQRERILVPG